MTSGLAVAGRDRRPGLTGHAPPLTFDPAMAHLVSVRDGVALLSVALGDHTRIGRSSTCEVQLLDVRVSRLHAHLRRAGDRYLLEPEAEAEVTVDGARLAGPTPLRDGAVVELGGHTFLFNPPLEVVPDRDGDHPLLLVHDPAGGAGVAAGGDSAAAPVHPAVQAALCAAAGLGARALCAAAAARTGATRVALLRWDPARGLRPVAMVADGGQLALSATLAEAVVAARQPRRLDDALAELGVHPARSVLAHQLRAVMLAPVLGGDDPAAPVLGLLQADHPGRAAFDADALGVLVAAAAAAAALLVPAPPPPPPPPPPWIGADPVMLALLTQVERAAATTARVLLGGESGTGKELIARRLHATGPRAAGPFVAVNCAALADGVVDSELFGHERGAFTGAAARKRGCFELADGGTLLLDEVAELPPATQARLLRVLQEGRFTRVGGEQPLDVDVRVIAASHRDLRAEVAAGRFREDLFFRLAVVPLHVPPLRERPGDLQPLTERFLTELALRQGVRPPRLSAEAWARWRAYRWPGNVRELRNAVERLVVLAPGREIEADELPAELASATGAGASAGSLGAAIAAVEAEMIGAALARAGGNKSAAARALGISRPTLDKKIRDHGLEVPS